MFSICSETNAHSLVYSVFTLIKARTCTLCRYAARWTTHIKLYVSDSRSSLLCSHTSERTFCLALLSRKVFSAVYRFLYPLPLTTRISAHLGTGEKATMVIPAQFQLGLELTNIVSPISQAMSALGSLAVIDAIKKSGSDFITETKLANLIGRHRIDPIIEFHFREMVGRSDQSIISRYLDIVLEAGSGPTVQEALKNPALFSMVIQLSGLAFAHENQSLANAIMRAIENIVQESGGDMGIVPDYVSLLGTLRACQQQTAAFRWALLYEATEQKIDNALASPDSHSSKRRKTEHPLTTCRDFKELYGPDKSRALPLHVLQGLFMWLQSLQSFPEHRLLHLRCNTGISTVVVWCHHILGLSVMINILGTTICFGNTPYNIIINNSPVQNAGVSLMDPIDPQEPLFTLQNVGDSIGSSYDHRAEAYGYGAKLLQYENVTERERKRSAQSVICEALRISEQSSDHNRRPPINAQDFGRRYPSSSELLTAGRFLFALDENTTGSSLKSAEMPQGVYWPVLNALVAIVITFARISECDLTKCKEIPLALNIVSIFPHKKIYGIDRYDPQSFLNLFESFETLSLLLLGRHLHSVEYVKPAILFSAWGWSVFLDSIDAINPFDVSVEKLRVLRGVPSRRGSRGTRVIDGPQGARISDTWPSFLGVETDGWLAQWISTAEKGTILVGHHSDAFQVTQQFTCRHEEGTATYGYGFRQMAEWSVRSSRLPPCQCYKSTGGHPSEVRIDAIDKLLEENEDLVQIPKPTSNPKLERAWASKDRKKHFFYVSDTLAARALQLSALNEQIYNSFESFYIAIGGQNTCIDCAIRNAELWPPYGLFLL